MGKRTEEREVPALKSGLTVRSLAIIILLIPLATLTGLIIKMAGAPQYNLLPLPPLILIVFNELLGKINPSWRIKPEEFAVILTAAMMMASYQYLMGGNMGVVVISDLASAGSGLFIPLHLVNTSPYKEMWAKWLPPYLVVQDPLERVAAWTGLRPGQSINWGAWLGPMVFLGSFFVVWCLWGYVLGAILRKPFVEIERLSFPNALPQTMIVVMGSEREDEKAFSNLFKWRFTSSRIFWISLIIGIVTFTPSIIAYFYPAMFAGTLVEGLYSYRVYGVPLTAGILPGALFSGVWGVWRQVVLLIFPLDYLFTFTIVWLGVWVIYPTIAVRAGWVPYTPGADLEAWSSTALYGSLNIALFGTVGMPIAIALWLVFRYYSHLKAYFSTLWKKEDIVEQGLSAKLLVISWIVLSVIFIGFFIAFGSPLAPTLIIFFAYIAFTVANQYAMGKFMWYTTFDYNFLPMGAWTGAALGYWPSAVPVESEPLFRQNLLSSILGNGGTRYIGYNSQTTIMAYKVGEILKCRARDLLITMAIVVIGTTLLVQPLSVWFVHNYKGISKMSWYAATSGTAAQWHLRFDYPKSPSVYFGAIAVATLVTFAGGFLRMYYPMFLFDPVALMVCAYLPDWQWLATAIALFLKLILLRVMGARKYDAYVSPFVFGFASGQGIAMFIIGCIGFFGKAIFML